MLNIPRHRLSIRLMILAIAFLLGAINLSAALDLQAGFQSPPEDARPWVYWFWMDGNITREGITADLEAMKKAGIGGMIIMEIDGERIVPEGPVKFLSAEWRQLWKHAASEASRLGLQIDMNAGPGWTGSGGPWITPAQSMQKVVYSETKLTGPQVFSASLTQPKAKQSYYEDIAVLAFPTLGKEYRIADIREKALYYRPYFSSNRNARASIPAPAQYPELAQDQIIPTSGVLDISAHMDQSGRLTWDVPEGNWKVLRIGHTTNNSNTRPAPASGLGLECGKLDRSALKAHYDAFISTLIDDLGPLENPPKVGLVSWHIDSWEMGPQNWTKGLREIFQKKRGYDPLPFYPVYTGRVVGSLELSERFLWDLRQTISELIFENNSTYLHELVQQHGMRLSIEPYDSTPCDDMTYCSAADVPMCEFWSEPYNTTFSCDEAASVAHIYGKRIVAAEAFTAATKMPWKYHPGNMKKLGDWAFCQGVNRFVIHRYAHQPWLDRWPGMTMNQWGTRYERTQTWWEHVPAWHAYLARCQFMLQRGLSVADICYLVPEGAPHVFRAPFPADKRFPPERLNYHHDGCTPHALLTRMSVKNGRLVLPDGMSYSLLVLPTVDTMTPELLKKVKQLVARGATVAGSPPIKSPSLVNYPQCDLEVQTLARELWGDGEPPAQLMQRTYGKGRLIWGGGLTKQNESVSESESLLGKAKWIWHDEVGSPLAAPRGKRYFFRECMLHPTLGLDHALFSMTADNSFELWVNGQLAGRGRNHRRVYKMDIAALLRPGRNLFMVAAKNGGSGPNAAGLIGSLSIQYSNRHAFELVTNKNWKSADKAPEGWISNRAVASKWKSVLDIGPFKTDPWKSLGRIGRKPPPYPKVEAIHGVLTMMGVLPDFEADVHLRFIHRREGGTDIYFIANKSDDWIGSECAFRVKGKIPEIWDPQRGITKQQVVYREEEGRTFMPLWLEPSGSVFVIFRKTAPGKPALQPIVSVSRDGKDLLPATNRVLSSPPTFELLSDQKSLLAWKSGVYELQTVSGETYRCQVPVSLKTTKLTGGWDVHFQPQRGAPKKAIFDKLIDLSQHADEGIRFFSGRATYHKTFKLAQKMNKNQRLYLDLGRVEVSARVKLNGKDLGILWKTPFMVDATDALQDGENKLEVEVANLWPNRLIGDASLPKVERVTWSTWNPYKQDSSLIASGLLGPVTIRAAAVVAITE
jgi:alpha-L-rhamnosidase/Glycosyl hydrolase 2 galactose-binding domain-like